MNADQIRAIEERAMNAWPSLQTVYYDSWLLRFADGFTKRCNSVNPLYPSSLSLPEKIGHCEEVYAASDRRCIFRLTPLAPPALDWLLSERGYHPLDTTSVMTLNSLPDSAPTATVNIATDPSSDGWLDDYARLDGIGPTDAATMARMLAASHVRQLYASLRHDGETVACGRAAVETGMIGLFDIVTAKAHRRKGYGRAVVTALLQAGREAGARTAYLQVTVANTAAQALYRKLGFSEAYRYSYRVRE